MSKIEVLGGSFLAHPRTRFDNATMVLFIAGEQRPREIRHRPEELVSFRVCDGAFGRYFDGVGQWTRALSAAGVAGVPLAALNEVPVHFIPFGQKALLTWANSLIGAAAATAALRSDRLVRFEARFRHGLRLEARAAERKLMKRLPRILQGVAARA